MKKPNEIAEQNFAKLRSNIYPGRGIIVGVDETGQNMVQVYFLMGRSENSRNRILSSEGGRLFTEAADPAKVKDPSLIIYNAMRDDGKNFVVSNGHQTNAVMTSLQCGGSLALGLEAYEYEPDAPNYTPRITAVCWPRGSMIAEVSILKKSSDTPPCNRFYYGYATISPGFGYCVTTYDGDGDPLPSFTGGPFTMPLNGDAKMVAETYWAALNTDNRISLAVKWIPRGNVESTVHVINRFSKA